MTEPRWAVVLFEAEDESVEAVPNIWLHDIVFDEWGKKVGFCYWPPKNSNISDLAKKNEVYEEGVWSSYPVKVLGENYDSYELARYKSIKALEKSDLDSSDTNSRSTGKKRRVCPKEIYSPISIKKAKRDAVIGSLGLSKNDSDLDLSTEEDLPPVLQTKLTPDNLNKETQQKGLVTGARKSLLGLYTDNEKRQPKIGKPTPNLTDVILHRPNTKYRSRPYLSPKKTNLSIPFSEFVAFKREVSKSLSQISLQLEALSEIVSQSLKNRNDIIINSDDVVDEEFNSIITRLPLKTFDEVVNAEKCLELKSVYENLVNHLSRIGGVTPKEATKRMLKSLLTDDAAQNFSFYGLKNKSPFTKLKIKDALFKSVKRDFKDSTDSEIEVVVKDWLRQAKSRSEIRNKTSKMQENVTTEPSQTSSNHVTK